MPVAAFEVEQNLFVRRRIFRWQWALTVALGIAAVGALGATGPSLACRLVAAATQTASNSPHAIGPHQTRRMAERASRDLPTATSRS